MTYLFAGDTLTQLFSSQVAMITELIESLPDDTILSHPIDDLVERFTTLGSIRPLTIGEDPVDGSVSDTLVIAETNRPSNPVHGVQVVASYGYQGEIRLFHHRPSTCLADRIAGRCSDGRVTISINLAEIHHDPAQVRQEIDAAMEPIRQMVTHANDDVARHNTAVRDGVSRLLSRRRNQVENRRELAGALGFPLSRRDDAPQLVPLRRKAIGTARPALQERGPRADEPALTEAQYEDALAVVRSTLLAMERTPSVASGKSEEDLRDQILVQLNGTFEGAATGETFIQKGKTDILVAVGERHVFVGECKWWSGSNSFGNAIDQLLGYLPWRNEKAALILFIDRKNASAIIEKAEEDAAIQGAIASGQQLGVGRLAEVTEPARRAPHTPACIAIRHDAHRAGRPACNI